MKAKDPTITQDYARSILDYNPDSGIFTWRERPVEMFQPVGKLPASANCRRWNTRCAGKPAGYVQARGYIYIRQAGVFSALAHRLAWFFTHNEWPASIDHINGITSDNRLENLRPAEHSKNMRNVRMHRDNALGVKGVVAHSGKYVARVSVGGVTHYLGMFDTVEAAKAAYDAAAVRLHGDFARLK